MAGSSVFNVRADGLKSELAIGWEESVADKDKVKQIVRSAYAARVRGDVDGTLAHFADNVAFEINARGLGSPDMGSRIEGKAALRQTLADLIKSFSISDWKEIALIVENEKAALHWRANVTSTANGRSAVFDVTDLITIRDGKIADFHQSTDTAAIAKLMAS
jgi:ketosteroid isomerase-like protein